MWLKDAFKGKVVNKSLAINTGVGDDAPFLGGTPRRAEPRVERAPDCLKHMADLDKSSISCRRRENRLRSRSRACNSRAHLIALAQMVTCSLL